MYICVSAYVPMMCQPSSSTSWRVSFTQTVGTNAESRPVCFEIRGLKALDVKSGCSDSEGWHSEQASVSTLFVSLLAPLTGTANLTTWLADKQLIDYGTAGNSLVYTVPLTTGLKSIF